MWSVDRLESFCTKAFEKLGVSREDAEITARVLVEADLREGGPDNITVVVVRVDEAPQKAPGEQHEGASVEVATVTDLRDVTVGGAAVSAAKLRSSSLPQPATRDADGAVSPAIADSDETVGVLESGPDAGWLPDVDERYLPSGERRWKGESQTWPQPESFAG